MAVVLSLNSFRRLDHHIGRAGDEVMRLQQPIDRSFGYKILPFVGALVPKDEFAPCNGQKIRTGILLDVETTSLNTPSKPIPDPFGRLARCF